MSELCLSNTCIKFFGLLISDLTLFCYFILSHPLYFSYFIFFSPYLLKLLSFLSPLFITTSLLLLALLTTFSPTNFITHEKFKSCTENSESEKVSILLSVYHAVVEVLKSQGDAKNDEFSRFEDFEVYKIVFQENPIEFLDYISAEVGEKSVLDSSVQEKDSATATENSGEMEEKTLEDFFKEIDEFESKTWNSDNVERKKIEALGTKADKVVEKLKEEMIVIGNGSKEAAAVAVDKVKKSHSWRLGENLDYNKSKIMEQKLGTYGSMRKEKEWTRTLACKLYEERHNANDSSSGEGMDLLWETYELDSAKSKVKRDNNNKKKMKKKSGELKSYKNDEEEEEEMNGQLCCLQALKFSAGKMNLGMGRPNLVKISKAIKGFGWLHHVSKKNKVHCGE
ncbi:uncharacterized protein LOC107823038 [Nicotiana tabacum]|uniref:Uncharacterized protein LOC107823038 n=2 Tax=Nicotiana TaxID=4085 RepID=A0A1S4CVF8_TOBAC|nr:PREDICTED: uncharacterized protein LOC104238943 [Nicotiana sylvestris]XP_016505110.1 PREDICTED: uncharacterized protein LOC107823038 [Nicotiana tabacum]